MAASVTNVKFLIGDLYDALGTDKLSIAKAMIARAQNYVNQLTGSASGGLVDNTVETYAALYLLQRMITGSNSINAVSVGSIKIGEKDVKTQIEELRKQGEDQIKTINGQSTTIFAITDPLLGF